ncbi:hypothetical protein COLO4_00295 [Corchorus olitorius]|uniref:Uncharacterized protein n=1 Tax=Corchorus olitorius TaxID=93759 RepID=A0A1R3L463_9ROSI|nr:hypothetical protein COLO4_00295 [Corchorus olitorius]
MPLEMKVSSSAIGTSIGPVVSKVERIDSPARPSPILCRTVTMPENTENASKVARLLYTNSGVGVLALGTNGVQKLWKWSRNEQNPTGKATASIVPQHWQPTSGLIMTNDIPDSSEKDAVPCIALSKNDSYVMSACGGRVSLFNMMTFQGNF